MAEKLEGSNLGPFTILRPLGAGAMGVVWLAQHHETGIKVALKMINAGAALANPASVARFEREAGILKQLKHPNIVRLFGVGRHKGSPYYAMERVIGESLAERLERIGRLSWQEVIELGKQLCSALKHAHDQGVIHRDLKPSNLMIAKDGTLKLTDFGIAKDLDMTQLTSAHCAVGTAAYMAPEQCMAKKIGPQTDLYALGVVLFELLTGQKPFQAQSSVEMFKKHMEEQPPRASSVVLDVPVWFDTLILHLMEKAQDHRPPHADVVRESLEQIEQKMQAMVSAGASVAGAKKGDRAASALLGPGRPNSREREAARLIRGGKSKKRKGTPFYEKGWFVIAGLVLLLTAGGAGLWQVFSPPSASQLLQDAERLVRRGSPEDVEAALREDGPVQTFLRHHGDSSVDTPAGDRMRDINGWAQAMDSQRILRNHARTRGNKLKVEPSSETAAKAFAAVDREDEGKLVEATADWTGLANEPAPWDRVANFHLADLLMVDNLRLEFDKRWMMALETGRLPPGGLPENNPLSRTESQVWRGVLAANFGDSALAYFYFEDAKKTLWMDLDAQFIQPDRLARALYLFSAEKNRLGKPADDPEKRQVIFDAIVADTGTGVSLKDRARLGALVLVYEFEKGFEERVKAIRAKLPPASGK